MPFLIAAALLAGILDAEPLRLRRSPESVLRDMAEIRARGPISESVADFLSRPLDALGTKCFKLTGCVDDVVHDDRDTDYQFLVVRSPDGVFYVTAEDPSPPYDYRSLIGATASFCGVSEMNNFNPREYIGRTLKLLKPSDITVLSPAPVDPFSAPDIAELHGLSALEISKAGRHRACGQVLAVWGGDNLLLKTPSNHVVLVELVPPLAPAPRVGDWIAVTGLPETDLHRLILKCAIWKHIPSGVSRAESAVVTDLSRLLTNDKGETQIDTDLFGHPVRISGRVAARPGHEGRMIVRDKSLTIAVEAASCPAAAALEEDTLVEVTGLFVFDTSTGHRPALFPRIKSVFLVTRGPDDIRVLAKPSWWTARRLLAVIGGLSALLLGILVWNGVLRRMVERRSRELVEERTQTLRADLKVEERTRLAVELHDSIAQSLSGVVMEVETAEQLGANGPADMRQHLSLASKALKSCNDDLRNCLWDLRCQALEEKDMTTAIEKTLKPHAAAAQLTVRFNVAREKLADQTAYSVLRIVRELVINAIRHGKASKVRIAGSLDGGTLLFSVTDDGCGFDPDSRPGVAGGHFGLEGIRERVDQLGGTFDLSSAPGRGTKAVVTLASFEET